MNSALGIHRDACCSLAIPDHHRQVLYGSGHFDLLGDAAYEHIRRWLADDR